MPKSTVSKASEVVFPLPRLAFLSKISFQDSWKFVKSHWVKFLIGILIGVPVLGLAFFLLSPEKQEVVTAVAKRGTLIQTVEAVGTVISEKDLNLKFPVTGVVNEVLVREGDDVKAGQVLATLRSGSITQADVTSAAASLQSAQADLQELVEGTRPEVQIAEAEVANKRAALEVSRTALSTAEANLERAQEKLDQIEREATINLAGDISSADSLISQKLVAIQTSFGMLDDIFATSIVENAVTFGSQIEYEAYRVHKGEAQSAISEASSGSSQNYNDALARLTKARSAGLAAASVVEEAYQVLVQTPLSNYFTAAVKETYRDKIATERTTVQAAVTSIVDEMESFRDASESYATKISAEESALTTAEGARNKALSDIATYETSLRTQEAQLALKKAGSRDTDIQSARARVNQAYAELQRARSRLEDTVLRAPIDGRITKADLKKGEFTGDLENFERAITMFGDSPYRVEIYASEIDIPRVQYSQTGSVELDAYPGRDFWLTVTDIDPAATDVDGVPKYRIKLDFVENVEDLLKIGMTGDVDIITDMRFDVVSVPGRAVLRNEEGENIVRVQLPNGTIEDQKVTVGMETDTDVEIESGIEEGDIVVVLIKN